MATTEDFKLKIQAYDRTELLTLWKQIVDNEIHDDEWPIGKAFEFLILRAFELEGAVIRWPFSVTAFEESIEHTVEQIDGVIHFEDINLSVLAECKDQTKDINIEPIAKLRNQLLRRPSNAIGAIFITSRFTKSASTLAKFLAPQTILLWEIDDIEYCLLNNKFRSGLMKKYRIAIEEGEANFALNHLSLL